jgi:hypothetical protein
MQKITLILIGLVVVCQCRENHFFRLRRSVSDDSKSSYEESDNGINDEKEESEEHDYCMPQCSYTCIATNGNLETWGQFHQRSTRSFYVRKLRAQLFCAYILALYSTGGRLLA